MVTLSLIVVGVACAAANSSRGGAVPRFSAQQARSFWTPARMRAARPAEVQLTGRSRRGTLLSAGTGTGTGAGGGVGSGRGKPRRIAPLAPRRGASASSATEAVVDPTAPLVRQNGVVFFEDFLFLERCSGTSVSAPNFSVVFTAAHCIDSGGPRGHGYRSRWIFIPGYRYGQRPFGVFPAKWLDTTKGWVTTGSENFDVGAAVVGRNEKGQRLADAVGAAGISWGLKANRLFDVHGYSAERPYDGETQQLCAQTGFLGHDPASFRHAGPLNLGVECEVTGGSSGGGWTIAGNILNSVTDYGYPVDATTNFGAYFGEEVARLYRRAAGVK